MDGNRGLEVRWGIGLGIEGKVGDVEEGGELDVSFKMIEIKKWEQTRPCILYSVYGAC